MVIHRMTGYKETKNLLSRAGFSSSNINVYREPKKLADDARNDTSFATAAIPKEQTTHVTIDISDGRQQTLTTHARTYHTNSTIYCACKKVGHLTEDTNAESSAENMDVEGSSIRFHMILVININLKFICFAR